MAANRSIEMLPDNFPEPAIVIEQEAGGFHLPSETVHFAIPGKPFAKQRPRIGTRGGFARAYTPKETVSFERLVGITAQPLFLVPFTGPVRLTVIATFAPAKSLSRKKQDAMLGASHVQRPDTDNIIKAISDGLNRIAYADDGQVAEIIARKQWGTEDGTMVTVERIR